MIQEINIDLLEYRARDLAIRSHAGQFRRDGKTPYINHVGDVVKRSNGSAYISSVAWLHDILEDTKLTEDDLREMGFPEVVVESVSLLTHHPDENYQSYIERIRANRYARQVKIADILSNLSDDPTPKQVKKYAKALSILI